MSGYNKGKGNMFGNILGRGSGDGHGGDKKYPRSDQQCHVQQRGCSGGLQESAFTSSGGRNDNTATEGGTYPCSPKRGLTLGLWRS
jgi:hypothetical protein